MSNETLDPRRPLLDSIVENTEARRQAEAARADGMTAEIYERSANAYALAMGRDLALATALALQLIHIISGKPALSAGPRAMFLKQAGYDWRPVVHTDKEVRLRFMYAGEWMQDVEGEPLEVAVTFEEAERAGWVQASRGSGKVGNYDKIPRNMLHARVISNFHRWFAPEVMGAAIYDRDEVTMDRIIEATEQKTVNATEALKAKLLESAAAVAQEQMVIMEEAKNA